MFRIAFPTRALWASRCKGKTLTAAFWILRRPCDGNKLHLLERIENAFEPTSEKTPSQETGPIANGNETPNSIGDKFPLPKDTAPPAGEKAPTRNAGPIVTEIGKAPGVDGKVSIAYRTIVTAGKLIPTQNSEPVETGARLPTGVGEKRAQPLGESISQGFEILRLLREDTIRRPGRVAGYSEEVDGYYIKIYDGELLYDVHDGDGRAPRSRAMRS